jgi:hypothetical protein
VSPEQHLDLDAMADVLADDAPLGAEEHVAGCAACRAAVDELRTASAQVTQQLAALPAVPMPSDLADRLPGLLRGDDGAGADDAAAAATTVTPFPTAAADETRSNPARWLAAAAAVAVLLAGGVYGLSQLGSNGSSTSASSASGAKSAREPDVARNSSGTDYTDRASLASAVPGLLAGKGAADSAMVAGAPPPSANAPQHAAGVMPQATADALAPLRTDKGLAECLLALLPPDDPSVRPLAIDYAQFRGHPAMVVVLPGTVASKLDIFVVGPACSRANDSVLFYTSVDKP